MIANTVSGSGSQTVAVVMSGSSTQILGGTNTYSGGTTVTSGWLQAGSASAFGATTRLR